MAEFSPPYSRGWFCAATAGVPPPANSGLKIDWSGQAYAVRLCLAVQRRSATTAQIASTSPNGQAPCRNP
jgi:hypothetical protein